jgi:hypothetical protein
MALSFLALLTTFEHPLVGKTFIAPLSHPINTRLQETYFFVKLVPWPFNTHSFGAPSYVVPSPNAFPLFFQHPYAGTELE